MSRKSGQSVRVVQTELPEGTICEATTQKQVEEAIWEEIHGKRFCIAEQVPICNG